MAQQNEDLVLYQSPSEKIEILSLGEEICIANCPSGTAPPNKAQYQLDYFRVSEKVAVYLDALVPNNRGGGRILVTDVKAGDLQDTQLIFYPQAVGNFELEERRKVEERTQGPRGQLTITEVSDQSLGKFNLFVLDFSWTNLLEISSHCFRQQKQIDLHEFLSSDFRSHGNVTFFLNDNKISNLLELGNLAEGKQTVKAKGEFDNGEKEISFEINVQGVDEFSFDLPGFACKGKGNLDLKNFIDVEGGSFSSVPDVLTGASGFAVNELPVGDYEITFILENEIGCQRSQTKTISIYNQPVFDFLPPSVICNDQQEINLFDFISGDTTGNFLLDGSIIVNGKWDISDFQEGKFELTYQVSNTSCVEEKVKTIEVKPGVKVDPGTTLELCADLGIVNLNEVNGDHSPTGGIWSADAANIENQKINLATLDFGDNPVKEIELTYSVENENGCTSSGTKLLTVFQTPPKPEVTYTSVCEQDQTTLTIENYNPKFSYQWYEGEKLLTNANGKVYTSGILDHTTVFKVLVSNPLNDKCKIEEEVEVELTPLSGKPEVESMVRCGGGIVNFTASGVVGTDFYKWYQQGIWLNEGENGIEFSAEIQQTSKFEVAAVVNGCEGEREEVTAYVIPIPEKPDLETAIRCGEGRVQLVFPEETPFRKYRWYKTQEGGNLLHEGTSYQPGPAEGPDFFVSAVDLLEVPELNQEIACESPRVKLNYEIRPAPEKPKIVSNGKLFCAGDLVELMAEGNLENNQFRWYNEITDEVLGEGKTYAFEAEENLIVGCVAIGENLCESVRETVEIKIAELPESIIPSNFKTAQYEPVQFSVEDTEGTTWFWDFGDGQTSGLQDPVIAYYEPGNFKVILQVANLSGCSDTLTTTITVGEVDQGVVLGGNLEEIYEEEISVFPNPFSTILKIGNEKTHFESIRIWNVTGEEIFKKEGADQLSIPTLNWGKGIYLLELKYGNVGKGHTQILKLVKQ
ncbi:PKD domain-containing protein [Flexithrix dorotheae]|uniref:Ig-like domain-containing protein n=1 Tax=Flexithrix dorotheae TaxID=70993 RepID=UPI000375B21A|nr:PKD domain-containing protein [Flexithrix dorotheae]